MIAFSWGNHIWLLLEDHDDGKSTANTFPGDLGNRRSVWLQLETGEIRHINVCKRVLLLTGWHQMPELQDKCDK